MDGIKLNGFYSIDILVTMRMILFRNKIFFISSILLCTFRVFGLSQKISFEPTKKRALKL